MLVLDVLVFLVMISVGWLLWRHKGTEGFGDWLLKYVLVSALLFGPYFIWDGLSNYWRSSEDGPVNIETGWW